MNRGEETKKEQKDSRNRTDEKDRKKRKGRENEKLTVFSNCLFLMRLSMRLNPAYFGVQIPLILLNVIRIYLPILFLRRATAQSEVRLLLWIFWKSQRNGYCCGSFGKISRGTPVIS